MKNFQILEQKMYVYIFSYIYKTKWSKSLIFAKSRWGYTDGPSTFLKNKNLEENTQYIKISGKE